MRIEWKFCVKRRDVADASGDFIHLGYKCKIVTGLIEFQARESSFSEMRDESIALGFCLRHACFEFHTTYHLDEA